MKRTKERVWKQRDLTKQRPEFYLTEREKKDGEAFRILKWLALADRLFDSDDSGPTPSAA